MPYASLSDMLNRYGEQELINLTDRSNPRLNAVDAALLVQAFFDADAEIDGYLAVRYALPLPHTPPVLMRIACDITRYRLYDKAATEEVRNRYTDAVKWLAAIARGLVSLGMPAVGAPPETGPLVAGAHRTFSRDTLKEY